MAGVSGHIDGSLYFCGLGGSCKEASPGHFCIYGVSDPDGQGEGIRDGGGAF